LHIQQHISSTQLQRQQPHCSQPARQFTSIVLRFNRNTRLRFRPKIDHETAAVRPSVDSPPLASTRVQRGRRRGPAAANMKLSRLCSTVRQRRHLVAQSLSAVCSAKPAELGFNENARENDDSVVTRSTQPCIHPWSLNRVPASAGVRAGMSPLPGGR